MDTYQCRRSWRREFVSVTTLSVGRDFLRRIRKWSARGQRMFPWCICTTKQRLKLSMSCVVNISKGANYKPSQFTKIRPKKIFLSFSFSSIRHFEPEYMGYFSKQSMYHAFPGHEYHMGPFGVAYLTRWARIALTHRVLPELSNSISCFGWYWGRTGHAMRLASNKP